MQAIILAAGLGRRLGEFTADNTKCMVPVNGIRLIDRMLVQLSDIGLSRIIVVVGYKGDNLRRHISDTFPNLKIIFVENPVYNQTNNIYSLWLARELMSEDDTLLLESDLIFQPEVLHKIIYSNWPDCALVSPYDTWMDGTMVTVDDDDNIVNFIPKKAFDFADTDQYYKTVNIYRFSKSFVVNHYLPFLEAYIRVLGQNEYYEQVLRVITLIDGVDFKAVKVDGQAWYEIDDVQDLRIAETIFASPEERLSKLNDAGGGYWRYPSLADFTSPTNPFFPTAKIRNEIKASFDTLLRSKPSSENVTSLLAAKSLGINKEYVAVAGEVSLLKQYVSEYHSPTCGTVFIGNPDYMGQCLDKKSVGTAIAEIFGQGNVAVMEETGLVFADRDKSFITNQDLHKYPNLVVVRSLSDDYGVPGVRIAVAASSDIGLIEYLRTKAGKDNVNSFAEFFLQICSKYDMDFERSRKRLSEERERMKGLLEKSSVLRPVGSSQANFIYCQTVGITSYELTLKLLRDHNILISDCGDNHVRIAVGTPGDNDKLIESLRTC